MKIYTASIPGDCDLAVLGDDHNGLIARCDIGIQAFINWVAADKRMRRFIHIGDACESRDVKHKYADQGSTKLPIPHLQALDEARQFKPIVSQCVGWMMGNHEWGIMDYVDMTKIICDELDVPNLGYACRLRLVAGKKKHVVGKLFLQHKTRNRFISQAKDAEQKRANMLASCKMSLVNKASDCHVMLCGHAHQLLVCPPSHILHIADDGTDLRQSYLDDIKVSPDANYIEPNQRWYACTGCYLRTNIIGETTYSERAGYDPVEIGHVVIRIRNGRLQDVIPIPFKG